MIALNLQKFMPAFTGIRPPYVKNGRNITPIAMNPTEADIKKAIEAEQTAKAAKDVMEGYNGYAFWLGEDLVVSARDVCFYGWGFYLSCFNKG